MKNILLITFMNCFLLCNFYNNAHALYDGAYKKQTANKSSKIFLDKDNNVIPFSAGATEDIPSYIRAEQPGLPTVNKDSLKNRIMFSLNLALTYNSTGEEYSTPIVALTEEGGTPTPIPGREPIMVPSYDNQTSNALFAANAEVGYFITEKFAFGVGTLISQQIIKFLVGDYIDTEGNTQTSIGQILKFNIIPVYAWINTYFTSKKSDVLMAYLGGGIGTNFQTGDPLATVPAINFNIRGGINFKIFESAFLNIGISKMFNVSGIMEGIVETSPKAANPSAPPEFRRQTVDLSPFVVTLGINLVI